MLHNHSVLLHFFFLFYGKTIFTNALPVTVTDDSELSWRDLQVSHSLKILGEVYNFELLSEADQGSYSKSYDVIDGFIADGKRVPAILKVVIDSKDENSKTRKEIRYLGKPTVGLLLHWEWVEERASYYIIVKNVREFDPPFKPLFEHYLEDTDLVALDALKTARETVFEKLADFAENDNLLYFDFHQQNIFFDRSLQKIKPIDWGPPDYHEGVEEIVDPGKKESEKKYLKYRMEIKLPEYYSLDKLEDELFLRGKDLRLRDRNRTDYFNGVTYDLERIGIDKTTKTFQISGGFKGKPALMKIIKGLENGSDIRQELEEKGLYLDSEQDSKSKRYYIIMKDNT